MNDDSLNEKTAITKTYEKELVIMNLKLKEFNEKLNSMCLSLSNVEIENGISYLDGKNLIFSLYIKNLIEYVSSRSLLNKEVKETQFKELLYFKLLLEKTKVIDLKLANQLEKHKRIAESGNAFQEDAIKSKIFSTLDEEEVKIKNVKSKFIGKEESKEKFAINKTYFDFTETKDEKVDRIKKQEKAKEKLKDSEMYKEMMDEYYDRPDEIKGEDDTHLARYMKEVDKYEEEMMNKVWVSKKKIKELKRKDRKNENLNNIHNEMKNLNELINGINDNEVKQNNKDIAYNNFKKTILNEKKSTEKMLNKKRKK